MNWLNNIKVRSKLLLVLFVMITGFASIGTVYYLVLVNDEAAEEVLTANNRVAYLSLKVSELVLQARRAEKDFLLRNDMKYDQRHDGIMAEIYATLDELEAIQGGGEHDAEAGHEAEQEAVHADESEMEHEIEQRAIANVDEIRDLVQEYQETFKSMVLSKVELGLDHDSGLQGAFRDIVHEVEATFNLGEFETTINAETDRLLPLATLLMMRRHEKDFIQRGDTKYVEFWQQRADEFPRHLELAPMSAAEKLDVTNAMAEYQERFLELVEGIQLVAEEIAIFREAVHQVDPKLAELNRLVQAKQALDLERIDQERQLSTIQLVSAIAISALLVLALLSIIIRSLISSLGRLQGTIADIAEGNYDARTGLVTRDELGELGRAFDQMLDDRLANLAAAELENNRLNDSIIELLEAVAELSERDLTVKVPVNEDVTGPVADAMNLLATETANVLNQIRSVAGQVAEAANTVQEQGTRVTALAANERLIVEDTMGRLDESSKSMTEVAELANVCNETAARASESTQQALETVAKTATGMGAIRETISETEKRIKRLGERSQEINGVVEIINNIAERTHVLALNASMQAAAAGEAGRGFAVVADEVQRLAESSRQSTSEIAGLVGNIQAETAETMATMNKTIAQVVDGTELAQAAGGQMENTQKTTSELAQAVEQIARRSQEQSEVSNSLRDQAAEVQTSTQETSEELEKQSAQTSSLVEYSGQLVTSVGVFKLPEAS